MGLQAQSRQGGRLLRLNQIFVRLAAAAAIGLLIALIPGAPSAATGRVLYVDQHNHGCANSGSGTAQRPFCSIGAAAAIVGPGQTVRVAAGSYAENVRVSRSGTSRAPVVFTAAPRAKVIVHGRTSGFTITGKNWIRIIGFTVTKTASYGIAVSDSSHVTLANNEVSYSGQPLPNLASYGIRLGNVKNSLVKSNTVHHNTNAGIALVDNSSGNTVKANESFLNAQGFQRGASGIRMFAAPRNVLAGNFVHDNEDSGIESDSGANDTLVNNIIYRNGDHGIDDSKAPGNRIIANTVYKNTTAGINVEGNSTGVTIANNISVDNGINSPRSRGNILVDASSIPGTTMDFDLLYLSTPDKLLVWGSTSYSSLAAFRSATGREGHGIQADPQWINAPVGNFHLRAGSPAIDAANSAVSGQPRLDVKRRGRFDDPAIPNTGTGPRTYDDRGSFEFRPPAHP
jgi:parallel beta-helix repeat protein